MPTVVYCQRDEMGREVRTFPGVLDDVRQTGCAVTDNSSEMTVEDTSVLFVGMAVACFGVAEGTYIQAIKDDTTVILSTDATGTAPDLVGIFKAFNQAPVSRSADRGWWRNYINAGLETELVVAGPGGSRHSIKNPLIGVVPTMTDSGGGTFNAVALTTKLSDELATVPTLRTKNEKWSFWTLVCKRGHISYGPFDPDFDISYKEDEEA